MRTENNRISVIIPAYNREKTIEYCLVSVLNQTSPPFEVIVVDDCSTDDTMQVVQSIGDPRIRCIVHSRNAGAQAARNLGIKEAKGDWIAFQDSDDEWMPEKLEKQLLALSKVNYDPWAVIHTNCFRYFLETGKKEPWILSKIEGNSVYKELLSNPGPMFPGMLVSRLALEKINYLDENVPSFQEWDTSIRLAKYCQFIHIEEPLFIYYLHEDVTISKDMRRDVFGYQYIINKFEKEIKTHCGQEAWNNHLWNQLRKCVYFGLWRESDEYFRQLSPREGWRWNHLRLCRVLHIRSSSLLRFKGILRSFWKRPSIRKQFPT